MIKLQHLIEQVKRLVVLQLAYIFPGYLLFLHLVWDEAAVPVLEGDLFDGVGAEKTN